MKAKPWALVLGIAVSAVVALAVSAAGTVHRPVSSQAEFLVRCLDAFVTMSGLWVLIWILNNAAVWMKEKNKKNP